MTKLNLNGISKLNQKNYVSNWLLVLFGISSIDPRRCKNGNNFTYFPSRNVKKMKALPLNEKIKHILLWKKSIQQKKNQNPHKSKKNLYFKTPTYSIDNLILEKFPNFSKAVEEFIKFIPVLFLLLYKTFLLYQNYDFSKSFLSLSTKLQEFFSKFLELKNVIMINNIFKLEIKIKKKKITLLLPKKYTEVQILGKKKTLKFLLSFQFQLAQSVISKILSFQGCKTLGTNSYYLNKVRDNCFHCPVRYYKKNQKTGYKLHKISILQKKMQHLLLGKISERGSSFFQHWNFSKNLLPKYSKTTFLGIFFSIQYNSISLPNKMILVLSKIVFFEQINYRGILFFFSKKVWAKHSLISSFMFFNFIIDSINLRIILPSLPYLYRYEEMESQSKLEQYRREEKKKSLIRFSKNFDKFYYDMNEISNKKFNLCLIQNNQTNTQLFFSNDLQKIFLNICFILK